MKAWVAGSGCVPSNNLMEDAATAEISRAQIWQWIRHNVVLETVYCYTRLCRAATRGELSNESGSAYDLWRSLCFQENMDEFLTLRAYNSLK